MLPPRHLPHATLEFHKNSNDEVLSSQQRTNFSMIIQRRTATMRNRYEKVLHVFYKKAYWNSIEKYFL